MKKGTFRFIGLAMGLCLAVPLAACVNKPAEQDTTQYKISITNKAELQGEWSVAHGGRKVNVAVEPEANVTDLVQSGAITFASSNEAVIKFIGQMAQPQAAGQAKLTVEYKGAKDEVDVTIIEKASEPAVVEAKPSEVMAADDTDGAKKYHVVGYVVSWGSKDAINEYGEMRVGDAADTKPADAMYVYGSFADKGSKAGFEWTGVKYTVAYDRDFLKNDLTKNIHIGDKVEMYVIRTDYGSTKEVKGQVLSVEKGAYVAATSVKIKLNKQDATEASVFAKEHLLLTSAVEPNNATDEIVWSAEDPTVASVTDGWVKGLKAGTTKIIATANKDVKAELTLTVAAERTITNDGSAEHPFTVEEACAHVAQLEDNNKYEDNEIYVKGVILTSSYSADYANYTIWLADAQDQAAFEVYATVISDSVLAAASIEAENAQKANGLRGYELTVHGFAKNYNNTLELGNKSKGKDDAGKTIYDYPTATALSKVASVPATAIALDKTSGEVAVGSKLELKATLTPFYSEDAITWVSSDTAKATVSGAGVVTGVAEGSATITAYLDADEDAVLDEGELFASAEITVVAPTPVALPAAGLKLDKDSLQLDDSHKAYNDNKNRAIEVSGFNLVLDPDGAGNVMKNTYAPYNDESINGAVQFKKNLGVAIEFKTPIVSATKVTIYMYSTFDTTGLTYCPTLKVNGGDAIAPNNTLNADSKLEGTKLFDYKDGSNDKTLYAYELTYTVAVSNGYLSIFTAAGAVTFRDILIEA